MVAKVRPAYRTVYGERKELEHVRIAREVLGRELPSGAQIHHVDGNGFNNANSNLVICPSQEYHRLLHRRQEALDACGNADWLKCSICKQWDAIANLRVYERRLAHRNHRVVEHVTCNNEKQRRLHKSKVL